MKKTTSKAAIMTAGAIALGQTATKSVHAAGSDVIKIGLVGCGGRGRGALYNAVGNKTTPNFKIIALADAFESTLKSAAGLCHSEFGDKFDVKDERMYAGPECGKALIENSGVDLVMLCEPPGIRTRNVLLAAKLGKHIFAEKPVATDPVGVRIIQEAAKIVEEKGKVLVVGHHLRYEPKHIESIKMLHDGVIGDLLYTRVYFNSSGVWTRPRQPGQTEMQHEMSNWYYFNWLSGDHIVEQHVHDLDVMNWMAGDRHPVSANGMGGRQVRISPNAGEIFDHHTVEYIYDDGVRGFSYSRHIPNCWDAFSEHAIGSKGTLNIDGHGRAVLTVNGKEPKIWERTYDGHQIEIDVMFDAILNGKKLNTGELAATATMTAILGRMATYSGREIRWDDAINSTLDLFPEKLSWDTEPGPKPGSDGIYPCAMPVKIDLSSWGIQRNRR